VSQSYNFGYISHYHPSASDHHPPHISYHIISSLMSPSPRYSSYNVSFLPLATVDPAVAVKVAFAFIFAFALPPLGASPHVDGSWNSTRNSMSQLDEDRHAPPPRLPFQHVPRCILQPVICCRCHRHRAATAALPLPTPPPRCCHLQCRALAKLPPPPSPSFPSSLSLLSSLLFLSPLPPLHLVNC
jgi:hypothetical protein